MNPGIECFRATRQSIILVVAVAGCASNPAPSGWLPGATDVPIEPYGAWVELGIGSAEPERTVSGELLAVHQDSLFVFVYGNLEAYSITEIRQARVAWYESGASMLMIWTVAGSLASVSHGAFGMITLPLWILGGSLASASQSKSPFVDYDPGKSRPESLRPYARFPQGIPPDIDRSRLRGKRWSSD